GPRRPGPAAAGARPDRPRLRRAARRAAAGPRGTDVRGPLPAVLQAGLRRDAVPVADDAAHRAGHGAAAQHRPVRDRRLHGRGVHLARLVQLPLHRARRRAAECLPRPLPRRARRSAGLRREAGDPAAPL
ncbi:MAG: Transcriptional regulator, AraC family, partial [uncultured Nocardioides sp.]